MAASNKYKCTQNTHKIHMVCITYIQQIYFFQHSFSYFIYLSYSFSSLLIWIKIYMKTRMMQLWKSMSRRKDKSIC
jgi:hypothetical protein